MYAGVRALKSVEDHRLEDFRTSIGVDWDLLPREFVSENICEIEDGLDYWVMSVIWRPCIHCTTMIPHQEFTCIYCKGSIAFPEHFVLQEDEMPMEHGRQFINKYIGYDFPCIPDWKVFSRGLCGCIPCPEIIRLAGEEESKFKERIKYARMFNRNAIHARGRAAGDLAKNAIQVGRFALEEYYDDILEEMREKRIVKDHYSVTFGPTDKFPCINNRELKHKGLSHAVFNEMRPPVLAGMEADKLETRSNAKIDRSPGTYTVIDLVLFDPDKLETRAAVIQLNAKSRTFGKHQMQSSSIFAKMYKSNVDHEGNPLTSDQLADIAKGLSTDLLRLEPWDHIIGEPDITAMYPPECYNIYTQEQYDKKLEGRASRRESNEMALEKAGKKRVASPGPKAQPPKAKVARVQDPAQDAPQADAPAPSAQSQSFGGGGTGSTPAGSHEIPPRQRCGVCRSQSHTTADHMEWLDSAYPRHDRERPAPGSKNRNSCSFCTERGFPNIASTHQTGTCSYSNYDRCEWQIEKFLSRHRAKAKTKAQQPNKAGSGKAVSKPKTPMFSGPSMAFSDAGDSLDSSGVRSNIDYSMNAPRPPPSQTSPRFQANLPQGQDGSAPAMAPSPCPPMMAMPGPYGYPQGPCGMMNTGFTYGPAGVQQRPMFMAGMPTGPMAVPVVASPFAPTPSSAVPFMRPPMSMPPQMTGQSAQQMASERDMITQRLQQLNAQLGDTHLQGSMPGAHGTQTVRPRPSRGPSAEPGQGFTPGPK